MPCCVCDQEHLTWKDAMMATAWFICDDCRQRRDISQHLADQEPPEYDEPESTTGPDAPPEEFPVSPV